MSRHRRDGEWDRFALPSTGLVLTSVSGRWQGRSKPLKVAPRRVAPRESRMNRKELARGNYPASCLSSRHRSLSPRQLFVPSRSLGSACIWRTVPRKEKDETGEWREREGREGKRREEGFSEDPPTPASPAPTSTHQHPRCPSLPAAAGARLDDNRMLHESCGLTLALLRCQKAEPSSHRARNVSGVDR